MKQGGDLAAGERSESGETPMEQGMKNVYDKVAGVVDEVWKLAKNPPVFVAVLALGILVNLAPRCWGLGNWVLLKVPSSYVVGLLRCS